INGGIVVLNEPKAIREPYSDKAFEKIVQVPPKVTEKSVTTEKPALPTTAITPATKPDAKTDGKADLESTDDIEWAWPTKGKVVANFNESSNKGIDISGSTGQAIMAAAPGKVIYSGSDLRGYGKLVIIKHNKNYLSVYAHNSLILVKEGQQVSRGQKIAEMGNTDSDAVKLHFEVRRQGKSVDPSKYLSAN
ncbi:MAG: peptidoglycan DD-metalloendopeptidase family protein, partial [Methylotenera sp.]|nr:peptidoglycan DD-metalloendopeptidase family protein [Methylotenera sp.]